MSEFLANESRLKRTENILAQAGFDVGPADGVLDEQSAAALAEFQESLGLDATGELDEATYEKLGLVQKRLNRNKRSKKHQTAGAGQKGKAILAIEQRLAKLGYDPGDIDGLYDQDTVKAVRAFRRDQKELKNKDAGWLTKSARALLKREANRFDREDPTRTRLKRSKKNLRKRDRANKAVSKERKDGSRGLRRGMKGDAVKLVQRHLRAAGFDPKQLNGRFDDRTEGAVKAFQACVGLKSSGRVTPATWKHLKKSIILSNTDAGGTPQSIGETSRAVLRTEKLLKRLGLNPGKVDGKYDKRTQRAVDKFRRKHKLKGRGKGVTNKTLKKMHAAENIVSLSQLRGVMPLLDKKRARAMLPHLNKAMKRWDITKKHRIRMFLAQLAHESVQLRYFEEIASGAAYEGRTDLGNTRPGDGVRYKGRGPIQLTGRANYRRAGSAIGVNLEKNPKKAATFKWGFQIAGWYWGTHSFGFNKLADKGNLEAFKRITLGINGGYNGLDDRINYWHRAKRVIS